jgi:hypothetical protein
MPFFSSYLTGSGGENCRGLKERAEGGFKRSFSSAKTKEENMSRKIKTSITGLLFIMFNTFSLIERVKGSCGHRVVNTGS